MLDCYFILLSFKHIQQTKVEYTSTYTKIKRFTFFYLLEEMEILMFLYLHVHVQRQIGIQPCTWFIIGLLPKLGFVGEGVGRVATVARVSGVGRVVT